MGDHLACADLEDYVRGRTLDAPDRDTYSQTEAKSQVDAGFGVSDHGVGGRDRKNAHRYPELTRETTHE